MRNSAQARPLRKSMSLCNIAAIVLWTAVLSAPLLMTACSPLTYIFKAFEDDRIVARFNLAEGNVLVLVDDPNHLLGDSSNASLVSVSASQFIRENTKNIKTVPIQQVIELERKLGDKFANLPVDQVGNEVGADQVVYVLVESAGITGDPGLFRPKARVRVNVIEVATGKRLFPDAANYDPSQASQGVGASGVPVDVIIKYTASDQSPIGENAVLLKTLANEIGKEVAELFYRHHPPSVPGYTD